MIGAPSLCLSAILSSLILPKVIAILPNSIINEVVAKISGNFRHLKDTSSGE